MGKRVPTIIISAAAGLMLWNAGESSAQSVLAIGSDAEITEDGLHRVESSIMASAWVRPDLDLSAYSRIFVLPVVTQFRDVAERPYTIRTMNSATEFWVSDSDQARLRELFGESFTETIEDVESYEISDELGRDVLLVRGLLTDVISGVPPDLAGSAVSTIAWAWEANIVLELRDSMSDEVLARTAERLRMDGPIEGGLVWAFTPRMVRTWSSLLLSRLEELSDLGVTQSPPL